ncbi:hypothetical protein HDF19_03775 [Mucilaginibacter sp. E4BP6]|uniref:hypothetical protein n=1 Tax=Mucilaginibacter sp. E4BP6 TaxID=2723089 RepID=UPI0015CCB1FF|nr:hypothetical protein [Mucilaginibacter sp. E4BP6]NYE64588.1 hypothetical protein [Mucilaginibacter sp. E4BP6]
MQEITIQIPFDYQDFIKSQKLVWGFMSKGFIKNNTIYVIVAILCLIVALEPINRERFPLFISFAGGYLFYMLSSWMGFYERRTKFFKRVKNLANNSAVNASGCSFIFSDYGIEYSDAEKLYKHSWSLFGRFVIIDATILIILKETSTVLFTLSKKELGDSDYTAVCEVLKEKLG